MVRAEQPPPASARSAATGAERGREGAADALRALERRVVQARAETGAAARRPQAPHTLAGAERDLLALFAQLADAEPAAAPSHAHLGLAAAAKWRDALAARGLDSARADAAALVDAFLADELDELDALDAGSDAAADASDAAALFDRLGRLTALELESLELSGAAPPRLAALRAADRAALAEHVRSSAPSHATRHAWAEALADRANEILTSIDELEPARAAEHLAVVADDLAWHVERIETARGARRARLVLKLRRLRAEVEERRLQERIERRFGARLATLWERAIVAAILLVLVLLSVEALADLTPAEARLVTALDTVACALFLWDFAVRWWLVRGSVRWFGRHFLVDLLPAIPYGLLLGQLGTDPTRAVRAVRLVRLPRVARYMRLFLPAIRMARALGFLARGLDRVVRRHGHLLGQSVLLHPTPAERSRARAARHGSWPRFWRVRSELDALWERALDEADERGAAELARARTDALRAARDAGAARRPERAAAGAARGPELCADEVLDRLQEITGEELEARLGHELSAKLARVVRLFARAPLRWTPLVSSWLPALAPSESDADVCARAVRHVADKLRRNYARIQWLADLHGTVTPAELVDRIGTTMVKRSARPAYRLLLLGGIYLLVQLLLHVTGVDALKSVSDELGKLVGTTLVVLGSVCLLILSIGWWLQRLASKATEFHEQVSEAQFLHLMDAVKRRHLDRDARIFERRVFGPEALVGALDGGLGGDADAAARARRFADGLRSSYMSGRTTGRAGTSFDPIARTVLLYQDGMDGGLLVDSDTRTTGQLLGNLALRHARASARRIGRRDERALLALDLDRQRTLLRGPYLWVSFITQAISHATARLIVDYNRSALPLDQQARATPEELARFEAWLASREGTSTQERADDGGDLSAGQVTTTFNALCFLDDDPDRDALIESRFGPRVLALMRRDRTRVFRRVFGSYPLHLLPRERRVLDLRRLYHRWFESGRALLLPVRLARRALGRVVAGLRIVARSVAEIRRPCPWTAAEEDAQDDFATARRKIDRMRAPGAHACLWLRARMDVEYLGARPPGVERTGLEGTGVDLDLAFLGADAELARRVHLERARAEADVRRLAELVDEGLYERARARLGAGALTREQLRAAAVAYRCDWRGLRSLLGAHDVLVATYRDAAREAPHPAAFASPALVLAFRRWWRAHGTDVAGAGTTDERAAFHAAWRATVHDENGAAEALRTWAAHGERAFELGERVLDDVLRHPGRITEQLVTLRVVQTLSLIDILDYREHVRRLGRYADAGEADRDESHHLLDLELLEADGAGGAGEAEAGTMARA